MSVENFLKEDIIIKRISKVYDGNGDDVNTEIVIGTEKGLIENLSGQVLFTNEKNTKEIKAVLYILQTADIKVYDIINDSYQIQYIENPINSKHYEVYLSAYN